MRRKYAVLIVYKSGAQVTVRCDKFTCNRRGGELVSVEWENAWPKPLHLGIDDVAAVYEVDA